MFTSNMKKKPSDLSKKMLVLKQFVHSYGCSENCPVGIDPVHEGQTPFFARQQGKTWLCLKMGAYRHTSQIANLCPISRGKWQVDHA